MIVSAWVFSFGVSCLTISSWAILSASYAPIVNIMFFMACPVGVLLLYWYIVARPTVLVCFIISSFSSLGSVLRTWRKLTPLFFAMSIFE